MGVHCVMYIFEIKDRMSVDCVMHIFEIQDRVSGVYIFEIKFNKCIFSGI